MKYEFFFWTWSETGDLREFIQDALVDLGDKWVQPKLHSVVEQRRVDQGNGVSRLDSAMVIFEVNQLRELTRMEKLEIEYRKKRKNHQDYPDNRSRVSTAYFEEVQAEYDRQREVEDLIEQSSVFREARRFMGERTVRQVMEWDVADVKALLEQPNTAEMIRFVQLKRFS